MPARRGRGYRYGRWHGGPDPLAPPDAASARRAYVDYLLARLEQADQWLPEASS